MIRILTPAHPPLPLSIATKDDASQKASRLYQAILSELAQAFMNGGTGKKDMERVFEGDPFTYKTGAQKILKVLDYLDSNLKSLWYTFSDQEKGIGRW